MIKMSEYAVKDKCDKCGNEYEYIPLWETTSNVNKCWNPDIGKKLFSSVEFEINGAVVVRTAQCVICGNTYDFTDLSKEKWDEMKGTPICTACLYKNDTKLNITSNS